MSLLNDDITLEGHFQTGFNWFIIIMKHGSRMFTELAGQGRVKMASEKTS